MTVLPVGDAGLLVELAGLPEVLALADAVRAAPPAGVLDVVPAARTVLLVLEPGTDLGPPAARCSSCRSSPEPRLPTGTWCRSTWSTTAPTWTRWPG